MPPGGKSNYTDKQECKADHIAQGYEKRGVSEKEAERRAWATVNNDDAPAKAPRQAHGSSRGPTRAGKGGKAAASRCAADCFSAKKAAATRKRKVRYADAIETAQ